MSVNYCALWLSLLREPMNRGKIYNDFKKEQRDLAMHLKKCRQCFKLVRNLQPPRDIWSNLFSANDQAFAKAIRELWNLARQPKQAP